MLEFKPNVKDAIAWRVSKDRKRGEKCSRCCLEISYKVS